VGVARAKPLAPNSAIKARRVARGSGESALGRAPGAAGGGGDMGMGVLSGAVAANVQWGKAAA